MKKADNFCLIVRKHDEARGKHEVLNIFADFCNSKNRVKERRAKKRAPLIRRRAATPFPPRGSLGKRK